MRRSPYTALFTNVVPSLTSVFLIALIVIVLSPSVLANSVDVTITERGRITSYFDEYWVVNVNGTVSIVNPTDRDLYEVGIRFDIDSLVILDSASSGYLTASSIVIPRIPGNSTVTIPYQIVGITLSDPALPEKGVLYTGLTKFAPVIYSDTFGQLQKAGLEDSSITGRPGRLVSVELRNPTGFQFTINSLRVIKTPSLDPNQILDEWVLVDANAPITISPDQLFVRDILDRNSAEGQVYWLDADVFISRVRFIDASNVTRFTERNLTIPPELLNYTMNDTNATNRSSIEAPELFLRKIADQQVALADVPVTISIIVNNYAQKLVVFELEDVLPPGFRFIEGDGWRVVDGRLRWSGTVSGRNANVVSYTAVLEDTAAAGFDFYEAAVARYEGKTVFSNTVPFVRQYVPSQRVYVQKKVRLEGSDSVEITLTVQNLGSTALQNVLLKEYLAEDDVFSQISVAPDEKGLWTIPSIPPGESFEVVYFTTRDSQLNFLPSVYGVPNAEVFRSLVLESVISTAWERVRMRTLEVVGILLVLALPVLFFVFRGKGKGKVPSGPAPKVDSAVPPNP